MTDVLALLGLAVSLAAAGVAIWQVRDAKRVSRLQAELIVIQAYLVSELTRDAPRGEVLGKLFGEFFARAVKLAGSSTALEEMVGHLSE